MLRIIAIILTGIITSFYFFPFEFSFLPGANTKMIMAGVGLVVLGMNLAQKRMATIGRDFITLSVIAGLVSIAGLIAVSYNETNDYTYATYIVSMWVWLGGAYMAVSCMRWVHEKVTVKLVAHYLIGVCVAQCVIAFTMDQYVPLKQFVDSFVVGTGFMGKVEGRLYGIGAALDVAGMKFATILIIISYLCVAQKHKIGLTMMWCYIIALLIIVIIGNMIGRTTTVGATIAILLALYFTINNRGNESIKLFWKCLGIGLLIFIPLFVYLYNTNMVIHNNLQFAFEGFFSLWDKGEWKTTSNDKLMTMYVWPDNIKTWLIGDGYINNPNDSDPYFIGEIIKGYYKGTDVGYCRFIFYFGVVGLGLFMAYFMKATQICMRRFKEYRVLFLMFLAVNFIVWLKVATDIFFVFALFLCLDEEETQEDTMCKIAN